MDLLDGFSRNPLEPSYSLASDGPEARFEAATLAADQRAATGSGATGMAAVVVAVNDKALPTWPLMVVVPTTGACAAAMVMV